MFPKLVDFCHGQAGRSCKRPASINEFVLNAEDEASDNGFVHELVNDGVALQCGEPTFWRTDSRIRASLKAVGDGDVDFNFSLLLVEKEFVVGVGDLRQNRLRRPFRW